ncbi:hypothetical protein ACE3MZ_05650 [Paenibacillus sp. WLX1005]|uniref:hypothetical protein n=1 Tax=Paenibacillus sp. WLX1005 TaxID=3243766 RepID=UPI003983DE17
MKQMRKGHWIASGGILATILLAGCSSISTANDLQLTLSHPLGGQQQSDQQPVPISRYHQATPVYNEQYPLPPEQLPDSIMQGNYETVYSQTSDHFKRQVSWNAFLDTLQSFTSDPDSYILSSSVREQGKLRQIWCNARHNKGIEIVFAEHHPGYPDHTILAMQVGALTSSGSVVRAVH